MGMITVEEAQNRILSAVSEPLGVESVALPEAAGRVLAESVRADVDIPPFTNTSMDGYAVRAIDTLGSTPEKPVRLRCTGTVAAGHPSTRPLEPGTCVKIMTGAPVPPGADAVVQVEWTHCDPGQPEIVWIERPVQPGQNLRYQGEDVSAGTDVLVPGTLLTPPMIGIAATVGRSAVTVYRRPRIAIVATGDELVEPGEPLRPGAIRNSNSYALAAAATLAGAQAQVLPVAKDSEAEIRRRLDQAAATADIVISSGGVSVGDYDLVKQVLLDHGSLDFWRVNLKPGKPIAYGRYRDQVFFGLPGNPVSALITFELFVRPLVRVWQGDRRWPRRRLMLPLYDTFDEISDRRHYVRARLIDDSGTLFVAPHKNQGSAVQSSWAEVEVLMIVPENTGPYSRGTLMPCLWLG